MKYGYWIYIFRLFLMFIIDLIVYLYIFIILIKNYNYRVDLIFKFIRNYLLVYFFCIFLIGF